MKKYHKIETLFERDMEGNKKLIEGKFRNETVKYLKNCQWIFTEKIDGTNIRVHWDGHTVIFGGRTDNAQIPAHLLNDVLYPQFAGTVNEQVFEQKFGETPVTLFGEGFGAKIQKGGGLYRDGRDFALFDVTIGDMYLRREDVEDIARAFNVPVAPVVLCGTLDDAVTYIRSRPRSVIAQDDREMEGIVGTPEVRLRDGRGDRIIIKVKVEDFA